MHSYNTHGFAGLCIGAITIILFILFKIDLSINLILLIIMINLIFSLLPDIVHKNSKINELLIFSLIIMFILLLSTKPFLIYYYFFIY